MISHENEKMITCTIVGDGMVGKTHICKTFAGNKVSEDYEATVNDVYNVSVRMLGDKYKVRIIDTSGQHDYSDIRRQSYKESDVFILCYSVFDRESYENIETFWMPEIRKICKKTPVLLVATGKDIKDENDNVTKEEGLELMDKHRVDSYIECKCDNSDDVNELFEDTLLSVMKHRKRRRSSILRNLLPR